MNVTRFHLVLISLWVLLVLPTCKAGEGSCLHIVQYIYHSLGIRIRGPDTPNIVGKWTSSSCEVRPGAQFVTRYIKILRNATWEGYFHRYNDSQCSEPKLSLYMKGFYKISEEPLESIEGSNKAFFNFTKIELYPHNAHEQDIAVNVSTRHCSNTLRVVRSLRATDVFEVDIRAFRKRACRNAFGFLESEFAALKLETRRKKGAKFDKLYFGEVPTIRVTRKYKPKSYQLPLQRYNANYNCTICRKIQSGTGARPPKIPQKPPRPVVLDGQWASTTCEASPGRKFLTRHFKFIKDSWQWECHYYFYLDAECKSLDFELTGKGTFTGGIPSKLVAGAYDYVFTMNAAAITPFDSITTEILNTAQPNTCGKSGTWKTHVSQDITITKGCRLYSISLPHTEYDLLKMDTSQQGNKLLYVGQRASDGSDPSSPTKRATSFQVPLVECSSFKFKFVPPTTRPTTRTTTKFGNPGIIIPIATKPTARRKETTTRRRTDRETLHKTTQKINENDDNTRMITGDVRAAYGNAAASLSSRKLLLILSMLAILWRN